MTIAVRIDARAQRDWNDKGWVLIPDFADYRRLDHLRGEADRLIARRDLFGTRGAVPNSASRSDRLDPVIDLSPAFAELSRDERLTALVGDALGGEAQLMKDKFIAKPPGADGYATHQDAAYWPGLGIDPQHFLTAILFLDDSPEARGAIQCAPGHHRALLTDPDRVADPDEQGLAPFETIEARAGDLLLLHALTPHRSGRNLGDAMRRTLMFTYGVDPRPDLYGRYRRQRKGMSGQ